MTWRVGRGSLPGGSWLWKSIVYALGYLGKQDGKRSRRSSEANLGQGDGKFINV